MASSLLSLIYYSAVWLLRLSQCLCASNSLQRVRQTFYHFSGSLASNAYAIGPHVSKRYGLEYAIPIKCPGMRLAQYVSDLALIQARFAGTSLPCLSVKAVPLRYTSSSSPIKKDERQADSTKDSPDVCASTSGSWIDREQASDKHWLDRAFPGTRQWLESKNRAWMIHNTTATARCALTSVYPVTLSLDRNRHLISACLSQRMPFSAQHATIEQQCLGRG